MKKETIIISLGGSLIVPDKIDTSFLKKFKKLILKHSKKYRFIIVTGGGRTSRKYQHAARQLGKPSNGELDLIGIQSTIINAQLIQTMFNKMSDKKIITDPTKKITSNKKIIIAAGWKIGCSSDYDAALIAKNLKAKTIINLSNIDFVYDKNPKKFKNAKKLKNISWKNYLKIVGRKWSPGLNAPFDPVASILCEKENMKVLFSNGRKIKNIENIILNKKFNGTEIE